MRVRRIFICTVLSLFMVLTMMPTGFYSAFAEGEQTETEAVDKTDEENAPPAADVSNEGGSSDTEAGDVAEASKDGTSGEAQEGGATADPVSENPEPAAEKPEATKEKDADQGASEKDGKKEAAKVKLKVSKKTSGDSVKSDEEFVLTVKASNKEENAVKAEVRLYFWDYDKAFFDKNKRDDVKHLNEQVTVKGLSKDNTVSLKNETKDADRAELKLVSKEKVRYLSFSVPAGEAREFDLPLVLDENAYGDKDTAAGEEASDTEGTDEEADEGEPQQEEIKEEPKEPIHVIVDPEVEGQEEKGDAADDALEAQWDVPVVEETTEETAPTEETATEEPVKAAPKAKKAPLRAPSGPTVAQGNVSGAPSGWIWKVVGEEGDYTLTFEYTGTAETPPTFEVPNDFISGISSSLGSIGKNDITEIYIPEGCTRLGTRSFQDMDGIKKVEIASTVKTIDNVAFGDNADDTNAPLGCGNLEEVVFKTNSEGKSELTTVAARAFNGCKKLKTIENLEKTNLTQIGYGAFMNVAVENFYIPDTVTKNTNSTYNMQYAFARNSNLKSISMPAPFYLYSTQNYALAYCPNLEEVEFREVEGATVRDEQNALPANIFNSDSGLKKLDLSVYDKAAGSTTTFTLSSSDFTNTDLDELEKIIFPDNRPVTIGTNTFKNKHLKSLDNWENADSITSIGNDAFNSSRLVTADMSEWTGLTTIGQTAFRNCEDLERLVIPESVTTIGSAAFKNCDNLNNVRIEAKQLTSVTETNLFHGDDNLKTVTISDKTKKINGNVLASIPAEADTFFEGENVIEITKATKTGGEKPIKDLNGTYYVDSQGVLYKLSDDGKCSLAYVPPGITSYTVPEKITTPGDEGQQYTVTAVDANALYQADDLVAIDFAAPQNVYLKSSAFTGWTTSTDNRGKTVQGKEAIDVNQWGQVSKLCDFPIGDATGELVETLQDTYKNTDGKEILKVIVAVNDKRPEEDKTYDYLTGQIATYTIAISNDDNVALNKIVRVYFSYSDDGYKMGSFWEGDYNIKNPSTGTVYPMKVVQTDNPNIYYYEITGILPGETLAFTNDIHYPSKETGGGVVKIWTETIDQATADANEGKVINPEDYMELDWLTNPVKFNYDKTNTTFYDSSVSRARNPIIMTDPTGEAYVRALAYRLRETNASGSSSTTEGLDFIKWVNYSDEITLPDELYLKPEVLAALQNGHWNVEDVSSYYDSGSSTITCRAITVTAGGKKYYVAYLGKRAGYSYEYIDNLKVSVAEGGKKLKFTWKVSNTSLSGASATNEYAVQDFYLRFGDGVIMADLDKVNELLEANPDTKLTELLKIHNETDEVRHYSYSPNQVAESSADNPVDANYDVQINKSWQANNTSYTSVYGGNDDFFNITINNTGILNLKNWGKATTGADGKKTYDKRVVNDTLNYYFYITPANMQNMLYASTSLGSGNNAGTARIGDWLTITITGASLYTPGQYQPTEGTNQSNKYAMNNNILHANDNGLRVNESARFVIKKNADGKIQVTMSGDTKTENNKTYLIGSDGDYSSIEDLFMAVGYMPTHNTRYNVTYDVEDGFELKPGQRLVIPIRSTLKTTPMMLTGDTESYYNHSSSITTNNSATVSLGAGTDISRNYSPSYYHYWSNELYMYKTGYVNNSSINSSTLADGTVIDNTLYAYNYNGKPYEHIGMSDYMTGAQVALVPAAQNPNLKAPDGSELERYTYNNTVYYLLNKPGEYKNVTFGRKTGSNNATERNGTQNWKADITVSETTSSGKRTSLNTLFKWEEFEDWGGTSATTYMHYKTLVSATKSGLAGADSPGEVKQYDLNNKAWLGDHQGHRLWDTMGYYTQVYTFTKKIITDSGALADFSRIKQGDTVTYQITINNTSTAPTVLNGSRFYDNLPNNKGVFSWEKGVNVKNLRFIGSDGVEITYGSGASAVNIPTDGTADDHWSIINTSTAGQQQIKWDNNFNIHFPVRGNVKVLVDLTFPKRTEGASVWDQYVAELAGKQVENRFYLDGRSDYVTHQLESEGKVVLYKGVYDNGLTTKNPSSTDSGRYRYGQYTSNNTRLMYQNGTGSNSVSDSDLKASTITYYTVLYNGSYDRLYLSDLEDQLPRGFTYNSLCMSYSTNNTIWYYSDTNSSYSGYLGYRVASNSYYTESRGNQLVTIDKSKDPYDRNTVSYRSAYVTAIPGAKDAEGKQHVTFRITGVGQDSSNGKYYLNPGEAVRFGYNVTIDQYAKTDDEATNTITMPYYDYYGTDFILDVPDEEGKNGAIQKARAVSGITPNDGGCEVMTKDEVSSKYHMNVSGYSADAYNSHDGGNFMVSSVTVHRGGITPGLQKTIGGLTEKANNPTDTTVEGPSSGYGLTYKGGAKTSDVVNWKVRMYNEAAGTNDNAGNMMTNYTIVDTVDSPFGFTGRVYYDMYRATSATGTKVTKATQYLFTLGSRTIAESPSERDTRVRIASGNGLSGATWLKIGDAFDDSDDEWFSFGSGAKSGKVKIERNEAGKEIMTIKMTGVGYMIPTGHWIDLCVHTMYCLDEVIISEPKYNDAVLYPEQDYDPSNVAQGRARTKQVTEDDGTITIKNDGIQSGASIMLNQGYTTSAWKEITEIGNTSNKARSDDSKNSITLSEKTKNFKYDLYVVGPTTSISQIVVIDDLPHIGDHSAFVEDDKRNSEFAVGFLEDDLGLTVKLAQKTGESGGVSTYGADTALDRSMYEVFVSTKVKFDRNTDWIGKGDGWTKIDDLEGDELKAVLKEARSIRVVVKDPAAWSTDSSKYKLYKEARLHVTFNAKINDKNANPGEYAWNSFGYKYQVPLTRNGSEENSMSIHLEAQPLNVGIEYPCAPKLAKKLVEEIKETVETTDPETGDTTTEVVTEKVPKKAERDMTARFIIYEGDPVEALDKAHRMTNAEVAEVLASNNIKYVYVERTVKKGKTASEDAQNGLWKIDYCSTYDAASDKFVEDQNSLWHWDNNKKCSIIELDMSRYNYGIDTWTVNGAERTGNNQAFTNTTDYILALSGSNILKTSDLKITKELDGYFDLGSDSDIVAGFQIVAYDKDDPETEIYSNFASITFNKGDELSKTVTVKDVPLNAIIKVTEVYASGYTAKDNEETLEAKYDEDEGVWKVKFENIHPEFPNGNASSGITNKYIDNEIAEQQGLKPVLVPAQEPK